MTDTADWLGIIRGLGLGQAVTQRPEPDFLELVQTADGTVGLARWSPSRGCGVLVVAGDRLPVGRIAPIALGQGGRLRAAGADPGRCHPIN